MKKCLLILMLILLGSVPVWAESETILSLSTGANTGFVGFTLERLVNLHSGYAGFGAGLDQELKFSLGYRRYLPDNHAGQPRRSNIYISPNAGVIFNPSWEWDMEQGQNVYQGYEAHFWGGLTMGYDHRWGNARQYRLTYEGGLAYGGRHDLPLAFGIVPIFNFSLGYAF